MDPRLTVSSVEDAQDGSLLINGKYLVERSNYDAVVGAALTEDVQIIAFHEEHYRKLILAESSAHRRRGLYDRAYSELSVLSNLRNQTEHGISERIVELIRPWLRGSRVLELGCGCGHLPPLMKTSFVEYLGLDVSPEAIEVANRNLPEELRPRARFQVADLSAAQELPRGFDFIYTNDFLEHLHPDDLHPLLRAVHRSLEPGGRFFLVVPNRLFGPFDVSRRYRARGSAANGLHLNELSYADARSRLAEAGFSNIRASVLNVGISLLLRRLLPLSADLFFAPIEAKLGIEKHPRLGNALQRIIGLEATIVMAVR